MLARSLRRTEGGVTTGGSVLAWSITGVRGGLEVAGAGAFSSSSTSAVRLSDADSRCLLARDGEDRSTEAAAGGTAVAATTDCATGGASSG